MQGAPSGNDCQEENRGCRLAATKTKSRPDQKRQAEIFERIVSYYGMETPSENNIGSKEQPRKQEKQLNDLAARPVHARIIAPQQHQGSHHDCAGRISEPPRTPNDAILRPIRISRQRKRSDPDRGADRCADHSRKKANLKISGALSKNGRLAAKRFTK